MRIVNQATAKYLTLIFLIIMSLMLLSGCVTQSFENNEPIVKNQANRDEMAATRISLGLGYLKMGDMSQAKLNLEKAKAFSPNLVQVYTAFAHYYETVDEEALAQQSFEQALTIKSDSADTLNNYGVFLCRQGKVDAAEEQFLKAIAVPTYLLVSESYENLSSCYLKNDDFDKAEIYLNKSIAHSPNKVSTLLQMVRLQYAMGHYQQAKTFLQKFERNTQRFTANSFALSYKLYWKLGEYKTAKNYATLLVDMYPKSWETKQYIINELALIDADYLAKKYQQTQKKLKQEQAPEEKKPVVKLSPNKKLQAKSRTNKTKFMTKIGSSSSQSTTMNEQVSQHLSVIVDGRNDKTDKFIIEESFYTVEPGDNLFNISVAYNLKISTLLKWNNISEENNIKIGDKLYVVNPLTVIKN